MPPKLTFTEKGLKKKKGIAIERKTDAELALFFF